MSNDWQDRVIRGGAIVVGTMGIIGAMVGLPRHHGRVPLGRLGKCHHPRRGCRHRTVMRRSRELSPPVADGQTPPPGPLRR